jgi:hypothetical protein
VKGREGESVVHTDGLDANSIAHSPPCSCPCSCSDQSSHGRKVEDVKGSPALCRCSRATMPIAMALALRGREGRPEMAKRSISMDCQTHGHDHHHLLWPVIIQFSVRAELLSTFLCDDAHVEAEAEVDAVLLCSMKISTLPAIGSKAEHLISFLISLVGLVTSCKNLTMGKKRRHKGGEVGFRGNPVRLSLNYE